MHYQISVKKTNVLYLITGVLPPIACRVNRQSKTVYKCHVMEGLISLILQVPSQQVFCFSEELLWIIVTRITA